MHLLVSPVIAWDAPHRRLIMPRILVAVLVTVIIDIITASSAMVTSGEELCKWEETLG